jgi:hypothetical protein
LAWLTLLPTEGRLPHTEQCLIARYSAALEFLAEAA